MIFQNPASILLVSALILIQFLLLTNSQVFPEKYFFPNETDLVAVNGSSSTGRCSNFIHSNSRQNCTKPTSSVLFDGNVPTLTGLDGDMWASHLLTINTTANTAEITFGFTTKPDYTGVRRVEVVMFNCPEWGISVRYITLFSATSTSGSRTYVTGYSTTTTSCDSLVRVCISPNVSTIRPVFTLVFSLPVASNWMHLAEVAFYASGSTCPPDTIITTNMSTTITSVPTNEAALTGPSSDPTLVIISVVVTTSIILIIVTIIVILILCKLYSTKHKNHKHNASTDTALGESYATRQLHNPHSESGQNSLCQETRQVYYSSPKDFGREADPLHQTYNRLTRDTHNTGGLSQATGINSTLQQNYEMLKYSTLSNYSKPNNGTGEEVSTIDQPLPQLLYAQVDKKKSKKKEVSEVPP